MAKPIFRPFPGPPPYPRLPAKWDEKTNRKWSGDLLRILDQQLSPVINDVTTVSGTYAVQITNANAIVLCDTSGGGFTVTLPPVENMPFYTILVKNKPPGGGNITLDGNGANIDGNPTITITAPDSRTVVSDGTDWWIV